MDVNYVMLMCDYHYWATARLLDTADRLTDEQFAAPVFPKHNSLRGTLVHTLCAEWIWRSRWQGICPTALWPEQDFPSLASVRDRWRQEELELRAFVTALREQDLARVVHYTNLQGKAFAFPLWQLMAHVLNHGTQHRSEAAAMLTERGHSPGDLDLIVYLQQRK